MVQFLRLRDVVSHNGSHLELTMSCGKKLPGGADEYRFRRGDGTYAHILDRALLVRDEAGTMIPTCLSKIARALCSRPSCSDLQSAIRDLQFVLKIADLSEQVSIIENC